MFDSPNAELGKLVRNSARHSNRNNLANNNNNNQQYQQQLAAATRNLYNRQQPMQFAPTHNNRRQYGNGADYGSGYGPALNMMGARNGYGSGSNSDANNDDEDSQAFGPSNSYNNDANSNNDDDGEGSGAEGGSRPMNLNQAASGYPGMGQNDYGSADGAAGAAGFNFGGISGYGPSADGADFGPSSGDGFSNAEGRRHKSASSLSGSARNYGAGDSDLAGALQYGPNSAINGGAGGDSDDEGRAGYAPENQNDNDNDDE